NVLNFEPENLHLVTDKTHPLYDERVHLPIEEGMVLNIAELGVLEPIIVWKDPEQQLVAMITDFPAFPGAPNTANVHPDEVENWKAHGWKEME
ncbi:TPA: hypothetical protein MNB12_005465, partial [Klebsiella pneumoniae]|nr:hypothetical protein [Klebsiella pneumoniae]HBZ9344476.1 hypothetical protein [Klebsiella pneumoniae]HBZ9585813.1 hypothetical protein [Klebsiella pneumoniae]HBZ9608820.1 hypothetical protein [Klebsiella pneumoniae]HCA0229073.1 hypothetical protein [Klebsiella pneumoniae]